jgi:probable HAF family extracellular repeat protein
MAASGLSKFCKAKRNCRLARSASTSRLRHGKKGKYKPQQRKREKKMKKLPVILIGLMACLAIGVSTARAQVVYGLTDLGVVKDMQTSEVFAINQYGHVAGTGHSGSESCAFHYFNKFMEDSGGFNSRGFGISSTNLVVGDAFFAPAMEPRSHAAMFSGGVAKDLGVLKGQVYSRANGLQRDSSQSRAFVWTHQTGMRDIGTLGGSYAQANAINEAGFITGTSQTGAAVRTTHAFIYQASAARPMRDLGVLGGFSSYGMAINGYNHVAGYSTFNAVNPNSDLVHAFFHDGKSMIDLGSLGKPGTDTDVSAALGVNKLDQVVGYSYLPAGPGIQAQQVAFTWKRGTTASGKMTNLNTLLRKTDRHYLLISATAINDNGQIVANAYDTLNGGGPRAVLLTPMGP